MISIILSTDTTFSLGLPLSSPSLCSSLSIFSQSAKEVGDIPSKEGVLIKRSIKSIVYSIILKTSSSVP